ncbi:DEAD/DEAH box helicase [Patescibacteria group bacterium]
MTQENNNFGTLGIAPHLLDVLEKLNFTTPTPIQAQAIPVGIEGKDLVGIAQTGTGKTMAFAIPMIQRIANMKGQGLVVLPTRELALQVEETFVKIGRSFGLRTTSLIGGAPINKQKKQLRQNPHIILGTPGRILDHLEQKTLNFKNVNVLVLDEADRMLDMGFAPQINKILAVVPKKRQTMLFSATMPENIINIARKEMKMPVRVEIARSGTTSENVEQELFIVTKEKKKELLEKILLVDRGSTLVFSRTKHGAKKLRVAIEQMGHTAAEIHSNRSLGQRKKALEGFKSGKFRVLVATDIAARGIDVQGIALVVNYDLPQVAEDYTHRIGRTARAGSKGRAITFAIPSEGRQIKDIENLIRAAIKITKVPGVTQDRLHMSKGNAQAGFGGGRRSGNQNRRRPNNNFRGRGRGRGPRKRR